MTRLNLLIVGLLSLLAALGIGLALVRLAPWAWILPVYCLTILFLTLSALAARVRPAPTSHFCFAYSVCGLSYLILIIGAITPSETITFADETIKQSGLFSGGGFRLHENREVPLQEGLMSSFSQWLHGPPPRSSAFPNENDYDHAGYQYIEQFQSTIAFTHLTLIHVFGLLGGLLVLAWTPRTRPTQPGQPS